MKREEGRGGKEKLLYRAARQAHPGREVGGKRRKGRPRKSKVIDDMPIGFVSDMQGTRLQRQAS